MSIIVDEIDQIFKNKSMSEFKNFPPLLLLFLEKMHLQEALVHSALLRRMNWRFNLDPLRIEWNYDDTTDPVVYLQLLGDHLPGFAFYANAYKDVWTDFLVDYNVI